LVLDHSHNNSALAQTNTLFNYLVNERLYKNIIIYDNDNESIADQRLLRNHTFIHVDKLDLFMDSLTIRNFRHIRTFHIHCKSNFNLFNYDSIYAKFNTYWKYLDHPIEFINFDTDNIRQRQSINQYLANKNFASIIQENDEIDVDGEDDDNCILSNLQNLTIFNEHDMIHRKVENLNLFFENKFDRTITMELDNLRVLQLNTTTSTKFFMSSAIKCENLQKLGITYSHSFRENKLQLSQLSGINFNKLHDLELRLNCYHPDCDCISEFYRDLSQINDFNELRRLSIINRNSKCLSKYDNIINNQLAAVLQKFSKLNYLYINLNEFSNNAPLLNLRRFFNAFKDSKLECLEIYDFFNYWFPSMALFDNLVNDCKCRECSKSRKLFNAMAEHDAANNYVHNFKDFAFDVDNADDNSNDANTIWLNKNCNAKLLSYIINQLQTKQFNQPLIYSMNVKYFRKHDNLFGRFQELFQHSCLNFLTQELQKINPNFKSINFGGVEMVIK
jgi:hypothetical protein